MKNKKEETTPTNVTMTMKDFIIAGKSLLRDRTGLFISEQNVLLYYLKKNTEFMEDYDKFCNTKGKVNSLLNGVWENES